MSNLAKRKISTTGFSRLARFDFIRENVFINDQKALNPFSENLKHRQFTYCVFEKLNSYAYIYNYKVSLVCMIRGLFGKFSA